MRKIDALIIGKGPAGVQAGIYIQRANCEVVIIGKDYGASEKARVVDNFYGFESINGTKLTEKGIEQAQNLGIDVITDEVLSVSYDGEMYEIITTQETFLAYTLLFASGSYRNVPRIRKIRKYEGKGVSYCAVCDGFFFKNKKVAVIGSKEYAAHEAEYLLSIAAEVYVLTDGEPLAAEFAEGIHIIEGKVDEVVGDDVVEGVRLGEEIIPLDGIFVAIGTASTSDLAVKLGVEMNYGRIMVDEDQATNLPNLYAAGDCTPGMQQIAKAVGDGCVAGMNMASAIQHFKRSTK